MNKGLIALGKITGTQSLTMYEENECLITIEKELKEKETQENALKTISDIIRDFNTGEFASAEAALKEITDILSEVLS